MDYSLKQILLKIEQVDLELLKYLDTDNFCLSNLLYKLSESRRSYLVLMRNKCYTDAVIVAGHILENCAIVSYLISEVSPRREKKYIASDAQKILCDWYDFIKDESNNDELYGLETECINVLKEFGRCIADTTAKNAALIEFLCDSTYTNKEKSQRIKDTYTQLTSVCDYLNMFIEQLDKKYKSIYPKMQLGVRLLYAAYCKIKHCGASMFARNDDNIPSLQYKYISCEIVLMCLEFISEAIKLESV